MSATNIHKLARIKVSIKWRVGEFSLQNYESSGRNYYFTASGCMSERIRHRYEKTSLYSYSHQTDGYCWLLNHWYNTHYLFFRYDAFARVCIRWRWIDNSCSGSIEKLTDPWTVEPLFYVYSLTPLKLRRWIGQNPNSRMASLWALVGYPLCLGKSNWG